MSEYILGLTSISVKFKLPAILFSPYTKVSSVLQAIDNLSNHYLEVPEACNIHPSSEVSKLSVVLSR